MDSGTDDVWESIELHSGYDVGDNIALTLDKTNRTGFVAYRQTSYPATRALLSIVETGNTYSLNWVLISPAPVQCRQRRPETGLRWRCLARHVHEWGVGHCREFATFHAPGTSLGEIDESGGSYGLSMATDSMATSTWHTTSQHLA